MLKRNKNSLKSIILSSILALLIFFYHTEITSTENKISGFALLGDSLAQNNTPSFMTPMRLKESYSISDSSNKLRPYYPNVAIKYQLPILRDAAEKGDSRAACILSHALLLCRQSDTDSSLSRYSSDYLKSLSEKEVESSATGIASHESAVSAICEGIDQYDLEELDERIYQSAVLGDVRAMRIFAMQPNNQSSPQNSDERYNLHAERHNEYAESMINRAADSGDPAALESIYFAYSTDYFETGSNSSNLSRDTVKSIAAFRALLSVDDYYLKSRYTPYDFANAEKSIKRRVSMLSDSDRARLTEMEDNYIRAYRFERRASSIGEELINELPEQACADKKEKT